MNFLFFVEREFHINLFKNLINYIHDNELGNIAVLTYKFAESNNKLFGAKESIIRAEFDFQLEILYDPIPFNPDFTFIADTSYEKVEGLGKIISIGHGTISKGSFYTDSNLSIRENCADLICVPGKIHKLNMQKYVHSDIFVSGMPKLDSIFENPTINLDDLGLDKNKKTVLIAPTYNPEFSILTHLSFRVLDTILQNYNIIIKTHGVESDFNVKKLQKYCINNSNIYYSKNYDITEMMKLADILISDVSSVIFEFLCLNKPILLFDSPLMKKHKKYNENDIEYKYRNVGHRFSDCKEIPELLEILKKNDEYYERRHKTLSLFCSNEPDIKSSTRIIEKTLTIKNQKDSDVLLVIWDNNKQNTIEICNKYKNRFEILLIIDQDLLLKVINDDQLLRKRSIIYLDSNFCYSSFYPIFIKQALLSTNACCFPILSNKIQSSDQSITSFFPSADSLLDNRIGMSISYQKPGSYSLISNVKFISFGLPNAKISEIKELKTFEQLKEKIQSFNDKVIAQDTFVYKI